MSREWCQKCQTVQNMLESDSEIMVKDELGHDVKVAVKSYQCAVCNAFIKSEETKNLTTGE